MRIFYLIILLFPAAALSAQDTLDSATPLPIVLLDTDGWLIFDEPKINANMQIIAHQDGRLNRISDKKKAWSGVVGIELRGKTSQLLSEKKPYAIELRDSEGAKKPESVFGMPPEHDWILLAPWSDKSLLRDVLGFELARQFTGMAYTPRVQMVEVYLNQEYQGIYVWTEKIKRGPSRVNIANSEKDSSLNGFVLKIDKGSGVIQNEWWTSHIPPNFARNNQRIRFLYHYPKPEKVPPALSRYMQQWMRRMEDTLRSPQFAHPQYGYRQWLDVPSFIDYMLLTELCRNVDGYRISAFFYKDDDRTDPLLHAGPVWDFNIAFGNADYCGAALTEGWARDFNKVCSKDYWLIPFWWDRLWEDPAFRQEAGRRWQELRRGNLSDEAIQQLIERLSLPVSGAPEQRNFSRWKILGVKVWPNSFVGSTWEEEVAYLRDWTLRRARWMDGALKPL